MIMIIIVIQGDDDDYIRLTSSPRMNTDNDDTKRVDQKKVKSVQQPCLTSKEFEGNENNDDYDYDDERDGEDDDEDDDDGRPQLSTRGVN